ncbi:MAG TPA: TetR family transcriptional regulator [Candidatus Binataceae bacterium]|nr:TetR family transcriptional regulator [Candidatus Binataceae bacterium]
MRVRPPSWLSDLLEAATKVFTAKGYRQTQMSDIAREMGVSQGTLYNYVESKEALFMLACEHCFSDRPITAPAAPPVRSPSFQAMLRRVREQMQSVRLPLLASALYTSKPSDARAELEAILREFYFALERHRRGFDLVESSTRDIPELAKMLYVEGRRGAVGMFTKYLSDRIKSGYLQPLPDPTTAALYIVETVSWFARHRHNAPDSRMISDHHALETTIHFLASALMPGNTLVSKKRSGAKLKRVPSK